MEMANVLVQDWARRFVEPDLGPKCLEGLSADNTSTCRQSVSIMHGYKVTLLITSGQTENRLSYLGQT